MTSPKGIRISKVSLEVQLDILKCKEVACVSLFETWDAPDFLDELISKRNLENLMYLLSRVRLSKIDCIPVTVTVGYEV